MKRRNALKKSKKRSSRKKGKKYLCNKKSWNLKKMSSWDYVYGQRPVWLETSISVYLPVVVFIVVCLGVKRGVEVLEGVKLVDLFMPCIVRVCQFGQGYLLNHINFLHHCSPLFVPNCSDNFWFSLFHWVLFEGLQRVVGGDSRETIDLSGEYCLQSLLRAVWPKW